VTVNRSTYDQRKAQLRVTLSGIWVYHFSQEELASLSHLVAGLPRQKALAQLERQAGVAQVTLTLSRFDFKDVLPADPAHIHIVYLVVS
jgi:hypothetical protein